MSPVEARVRRRIREVNLATEDVQDALGRLQSVGMGLESLGSTRDASAATRLILKMRRDLELAERNCS